MSTANAPETVAAICSAREARRLARLRRKVLRWWNTTPDTARRTHYLGAQLAAAIGLSMTSLGPALKAMGWQREQVRLAGRQVPVWLAPGAPSIKRPRGRPQFYNKPLEAIYDVHNHPQQHMYADRISGARSDPTD